MNSIELVTIVISRERITVQAIGNKTMYEDYRRERRATIKRVSGDFEAEPELDDREDLVFVLHDLVALGSTIRDIQEELNKGA
jgi:hypothetical protein